MTNAPVLIVGEGDVLVRHALSEYLRTCGFAVIEAASSDEVTMVLGDAGLDVDIVLCDAQLPGAIGGFGLRRWLATHRPDVQLELAGGVAAAADAAAGLCEHGPRLARPYDQQSVVDRIKRLRAARDRNT